MPRPSRARSSHASENSNPNIPGPLPRRRTRARRRRNVRTVGGGEIDFDNCRPRDTACGDDGRGASDLQAATVAN
ncbi:hypothetical protein BS78_K078700 [Paspalum vaginatum]|uniref:Uncharacterized protein n=1 Tax=Paspalum vaginatum TaxID=158149 RepID=A0A9W7XA07_9POAL|nr:hypothetical protein BS78_K078700 [Paspalum vaginatum]